MNPETAYIFDENQADRELIRLHRVESALDAFSHGLLTRTGVARGWACLEIGAGAGSILRWLGEQAGPSGRVVGVDKNTRYLRQFTSPPFEIIEGDVLEFKITGRFDLIHCRYVLIHNQAATAILSKLKALLKPGGFLVLEEPDFESAAWIDDEYRSPGDRVNHAICSMFAEMSLDAGYGKRLPSVISNLGLVVSHTQIISHLEPDGGPVALVMADSAEALRTPYVARGKANNHDVDCYIQGARDPRSRANYYSTCGVVAINAAT